MNILALHGSSDLYGSSKVFLETLKILQNRGDNITVVLSEEGPLTDELLNCNIYVRIIRLGILRRKYFNPIGIINRLHYSIKAYGELKKITRENNIDFIYSNTTAVLIGAILAKRNKINHLWHVHEIIISPRVLFNSLSWFMNNTNGKIVAVSNAVKKNWGKRITKKNILVINNGFDYSEFAATNLNLKTELNIPENSFLIGTIGRISKWKGQNYFISIAKQLIEKCNNVFFVIVGDAYKGNEHLIDDLKLKISESPLKNNVFFLGFRKDIPYILSSLDLFVLPSILPDPFPTVILEAMAAGKPVVATNQGGAPEMIVENETGILIELNDVENAANKIHQLLLQQELLTQMGEAGRKRVLEQFSLDLFKEEILKAFQ